VLKGIISQEEAVDIFSKIRFDFMRDSYFTELKEAEMMTNRLSLAQAAEPYVGKYYSHHYVRSNILRQTEEDMKENDEQIAEDQKANMELQKYNMSIGAGQPAIEDGQPAEQESQEPPQ